MKRICLLILAAILLTGCASVKSGENSGVKVIIEETPWAVVENNGMTVNPGEDAVLQITALDGFSLVKTDYNGAAEITQEGTHVRLVLKDVRYPTRVALDLSHDSYALHYDPNGGEGEAFTQVQDKKYHLRPNAANANVPFTKENATLLNWNTEPDGSGIPVGLGSRVTVAEEGITLYAQWSEWTDENCFTWEVLDNGTVITGCSYSGNTIVIPAHLGGQPVTRLAPYAFSGCCAKTVVLPNSLRVAEDCCFADSNITELYLFDSIEQISDACFPENQLQTLHINAAEAPAGAAKYKESVYADKLDLLILSQARNRVVFYAGCSMWYNLDMPKVLRILADEWYPVNLALNGTVNSELQLQIMLPYLHEGDIFFHTPEFSSDPQMFRTVSMGENENRLWAGIEYNYDLLAAADLRSVAGELDSLCKYLGSKQEETAYTDRYTDSKNRLYFGANGEIPFARYDPESSTLGDVVTLNKDLISAESVQKLGQWYTCLQDRGVSVFVSFACLNLDALSAEERDNVHAVNDAFREAIEGIPGVVLLSDLMHFTYHNGHFYDTNYHLLSDMASSCTTVWMKALKPYLSES